MRLLILLIAAACSREPGSSAGAPRLRIVNTIIVHETDSAYIADPHDLAVGPDGTVFVSDRFSGAVHRINRAGWFDTPIGKRGRGPGELNRPTHLLFDDDDSAIYVVDTPDIEKYDVATGAHLMALHGITQASPLARQGKRLYAGQANIETASSIALIGVSHAPMAASGPFPELLRHPLIFQILNSVALAISGDTAATAFAVTNTVYLSRLDGTLLDSFPVAAARRNGAHPKVLRSLLRNPKPQRGIAAVYGSSSPTKLHWLPDGRLAIVHTDWRLDSNRFVDSSYVSLLNPRARASCVDARIPGPTDPGVVVGFRGDTLFALSRSVGSNTSIRTVVRLYLIDASECA